jgi:glycosyltransferase involved in cell wall biosynthesis
VKPSILLIGNFLSAKGGNRSIAEEFTQRLKESGYSVKTTSSLQSRPFRLFDMLSTVFLRRKSYQIAYVEVYSGAAFLWAELTCRLLLVLGKPYILTLHGGNLPAFARRWSRRVKQVLQGARAVTAPSRYLQEEMRPYREDIILIPNALDLKKYTFRLRLKPRPNLVWLRAFHSIYNPQMAPLLVDKLLPSFPDISLAMIGPDKGDGSLQETQAIIEKLSLQKNIVIIPGIPKSEVPEYVEKADIFINTTNFDNTPVSVLEAMACGLCMVSTNVGGIPYLLQDGQDALLVPPNDSEAMANAAGRIMTEPRLAERLSQNARKKVEQYDWSVILPQWEDLFFDITRMNAKVLT